jgi:hypothetical protein
VRRRAENKRRHPSVPVVSPELEVPDDLELAEEIRKIELSTASSVYGRGQTRL